MNRLALFSLVLVGAGCAADGAEGFEILHNLSPGTTANECKVQAGGAMLPHGMIELSSPTGYVFTPELSSRIVVTDGTTASQRTISLRGARVELVNAMTDTTINKYRALFSGSLPPGGTVTTSFTILPPNILSGIAAGTEVLAKITPFGALGGSGDDIDGVTFFYPITVCDFRSGPCVVANAVSGTVPACPIVGGDLGNPNGCNAFQDGSVNCCMGASGVICPTTTTTAAQ
jgi:hypothetical protein